MELYEQKHYEMMRALAPECMVILKKKGDFPMETPCPVALYGGGARRTVKGGTGSGEVNSRFYVTVEEGLQKAGFTITTGEWLDSYDRIITRAKEEFVEGIRARAREQHKLAIFESMGKVMLEPDYLLPVDGAGDTAIYILSRNSGEGNDRIAGAGDYGLTETEVRDILACQRKYAHFMLVLNVGGPIDLSPVMEVENILLLSQLGVVTGDALADVLLGQAFPSGRLSDTWCSLGDLTDPAAGEFRGEDDTRYTEGIYSGYRRFDSRGERPLFPFGYGLSWTAFSQTVEAVRWEEGAAGRHPQAMLEVLVKNTGVLPGKEVVQVYATAPWGKLDHPYQMLAAFAKTGQLAPGQEERLQIFMDPAALASWDTEASAYILEKGDYILRAGRSSRQTQVCGLIRVPEQVTVRSLSRVGGEVDFKDWMPEHFWAEEETGQVPVLDLDPGAFDGRQQLFASPSEIEDKRRKKSRLFEKIQEKADKLSTASLASLCIGSYKKGPGFVSVIGSASSHVAGAAGESSSRVGNVAPIIMADGPAGLRLSKDYVADKDGARALGSTVPEGMADFLPPLIGKIMTARKPVSEEKILHQYCTAIPIGTALAQTWNPEAVRCCGDLVGEEMQRFGVQLWLAPGMNIHRNPLCGRNFEYYSEDPLLSGTMAAAVTRGVQAHPSCGTTIKHFCCNNQETDRYQNNSCVSERALREIYLRGFEIAVRESEPEAIMTSYNLLNGIHTSEREDLLETVVREEWDYQGLVMSDWIIAGMRNKERLYRTARADWSIHAGNELFMPGSAANYKEVMVAAGGKPSRIRISRERLLRSASRVILTSRCMQSK